MEEIEKAKNNKSTNAYLQLNIVHYFDFLLINIQILSIMNNKLKPKRKL